MKKRYIVLLIILAIIAGGIYWFMTSFESIVKKVVHKYGSEVTLTDVNISGLDLSLREGTASIKEITVANPKNYDTPYLFELGEISVKVDIKSITTDTIIIDYVHINKPIVTYEMLSLTQNNINEVLNNVKGYSARQAKDAPKKAEAKKEAPSKESASSKKVIIKQIVIDQGQLNAVANLNIPNMPKQDNKISVALPKIVINDVGQSKGGENIAGAMTKIITEILNVASQTVVKSNLTDIKALAQKNLDGVVDSVKGRIEETGGLFKETGDNLKDSLKLLKKK